MSLTINREEFLSKLESVQPGLSQKENVEQSACFVFKDGQLMTYNDEVACRHASPLKKITGAIPSAPLLAILHKLKETEVEVGTANGHLVFKGKKKTTGVRMDAEVLLPVDDVEKPGDWKKLNDEFCEAVFLVHQCAGKDESEFWTTCVHIHPKWLEATDNFRMTRYKMKTGFTKPVLVKATSLKHIVSLGMTEFSETDNWLHFRNSSGLVLSCRRSDEEYPDLAPWLEGEGAPMVLPKGLAEAAEKAEVFSGEDADKNLVRVDLNKKKLRIRGEGSSGFYTETKKITYTGPELCFFASPKLLVEITRRYNECVVSEKTLKIKGGKFVLVLCLNSEEDLKDEPAEAEEEADV